MSNPPETPPPPEPGTPPAKTPPPARRSIPHGFILAIVAFVILLMFLDPVFDRTAEISYGFFRQQLDKGNIASGDLQGLKLTGEFTDPPLDPTGKTNRQGEPVKLEKKFTTTVPVLDEPGPGQADPREVEATNTRSRHRPIPCTSFTCFRWSACRCCWW